jgi:hypothetical protein
MHHETLWTFLCDRPRHEVSSWNSGMKQWGWRKWRNPCKCRLVLEGKDATATTNLRICYCYIKPFLRKRTIQNISKPMWLNSLPKRARTSVPSHAPGICWGVTTKNTHTWFHFFESTQFKSHQVHHQRIDGSSNTHRPQSTWTTNRIESYRHID